jgi:GntR family transcriptional regulator
MTWEFTADRPIYLQLMEQIELQIVSGAYPPGGKLPAVRDLAAEASVNPNTMQKALAELERMGLVYAQRTSGRFITEDTGMIQKARQSLALEQIAQFLQRMGALGYSHEETLALMQKAEEEILA